MTASATITFVSHTSQPGGGELALRRYLDVTPLPVRLVTTEPGGVWAGLKREVVYAPTLLGLRSALGESGLVVANSMRAAFLTALVLPDKGRFVYWVRDGLTHSAISSTGLWLTRHVTARRAFHYLANSEWTAGTVRDVLGVEAHRIDIVHSMCGVSNDVLARVPRTGDARPPLRLLFLGRTAPWKAPDLAVGALQVLRGSGVDATLTIAGADLFGEGAYSAWLARLAKEAGVEMLGHVEDVHALLETHDVLLHCSTVPEPFGQVIVQALSTGMGVCATRGGGPEEILVASPVDLTYPAGDAVALADTALRVRAALGEVSRWGLERAADYRDEVVAAQLDAVLVSLAMGSSSRRD